MAGTVFEKRLFDEIAHIRSELDEIKEHMVDVDTILSEEERKMVSESFKNEAEGKLVSLSDFKKNLGN